MGLLRSLSKNGLIINFVKKFIEKKHILFICLIILITGSTGFAEDWFQYLGPNRNAVSAEKGIIRSWPEGGPEVLWTFPLGKGYGGPVLNKGMVYILDRIADKKDILRCVNFASACKI